MERDDSFEGLVEKALGPEDDTPVPPQNRPGCLPAYRFLVGFDLSKAESAHVSRCEHCTRRIAGVWRVRCPGWADHREYLAHPESYAFTLAMRRHLEDFGCKKCRMVQKAVALFGGTAIEDGMAAKVFGPQDLSLVAASASGSVVRPRRLISLQATRGFNVKVTILEASGELRIRGVASTSRSVGKTLCVDLWDDTGNHTFKAKFRKRGEKAVATTKQALPASLARDLRGEGAVVAWIQASDDSA